MTKKNQVDLDKLAAAIHEYYRQLCKKAGWPMKYDLTYSELPDDIKADNLAAAARIPLVLSRVGLIVVCEEEPGTAIRPKVLEDKIESLAEAEHEGWMEQKITSGWVYGSQRDEKKKIHNSLVPYKDLPDNEKEKDRNSVRHYPDIVKLAGCKIIQKNTISS